MSGDLAPGLRGLARDYEFVRELGRGGMAVVYLARERASGRLVAIKAVDRRYGDDPEAVARFAREAHTVADLDHPNIVRTHSIERLGPDTLAIVMQHVPGGTLRELLDAEGPLSFERATAILRDVAEALRYAHARGLVHRDVKPENIFLEEGTERALLSDFGIARMVEDESGLTLTGTAIGTPTYMSPEQIDGRPLDARSDIYSLGLVGWEMLAGSRPWDGESLYSVIYKQKHEELPRLTTLRPGIPEPLLFAIEGALLKHRDTRWASAGEFLDELLEAPPAALNAAAAPVRPPEAAAADDGAAAAAVETDASPVVETDGSRTTALAPYRLADARRRPSARLAVPLVLALLAAVAVGGGRRSHQRAAAAAQRDSARVTTESEGAIDTLLADSAPFAPGDIAPAPAGAGSSDSADPRASAERASPAPAPARPRGRQRTATGRASAPLARYARTHGDSLSLCRSAVLRDQRTCLAAVLADNDRGLNNVYRTLVGEMRREEGVAPGAADPAPVLRLRAEQRAWLAERDAECAREARGKEGALWAVPRSRCLGELGTRRAAILADRLTRLRAP